jgi:hypothetical protein
VPAGLTPFDIGGASTLTGFVRVTLAIGVFVDEEHSPAEHAEDIAENTKRLFPAADVTVLEVQTEPPSSSQMDACHQP